jgi:hypothetical protein
MKLCEYMVTTGQRWVKDDIIFVRRYWVHSSDMRCWRNYCPLLLGVQVSCLFTEQWHAPHRKGLRWLHINQNADTCNWKDSIRQWLQWLLHWTSASIPMRKQRIPQRHWRSDGCSATMTPLHQRSKYLPRRNPPDEPAPTTMTPPTQRMTTTATARATPGAMRTTTSSPMTHSIS